MLQRLCVYQFNFPSVNRYDFLSGECREGSNGVAGCHIGKIGQLFTA